MNINKREKTIWNLVIMCFLIVVYLVIEYLAKQRVLLPYHLQILSLVNINIILVVSLNLINGFTGQFSIGHAAFLAIGAYLSAALTMFYSVPFFVAIILSGIAAAIVGVVIALPALRLKGDYLAIATLGFGEIVRVIILNISSVGGPRGFSGIPRYTTFGMTYLLAIASILIIKNFIDSSHGRACVSIREDEIASESLGINSTFYKVTAFAIGAFFAGIAGSMFSHYMAYISPSPSQIGFLKSIDILIMLVLGGLGSLTGSVISAGFLTFLPEMLRDFAEYRMVIYPVLLLLIMLFRPKGLMAGHELSYQFLNKVVRRVRRTIRPKEVDVRERKA